MRPIILTMAAACSAMLLVACQGSYMGLRECQFTNCYTIRKGVTPQEFFGRRSPVYPPDASYRIDGNTWDVWVFDVGTTEPASIPTPDDATSTGGGSFSTSHNEYVAFKDGRLEDWGWGKAPRVVKQARKRAR